jgi:hypothetical protein
MENRFFVEAKSFSFSVVSGKPELRLEERRKGFAGAVSLGPRCVAWLIVTIEEVLRSTVVEEFVRSTREASNEVTVKRGGNRAGRFLEVASQVLGGRRGFILLPEGRGGWGWSRFSGELSKVMAFFEAMRGPSLSGPGSGLGVFLEPSAKEASSQLQVQPVGAADSSCGAADREAGPGAGGKGVQSTPEALRSLLGAWEDRFEKMIGKMDRVIAAVWVGLVQFGLGCGSVLRNLGPGTLRRARFFGKLKPKLKPKFSFLGKRPHQLSAQASKRRRLRRWFAAGDSDFAGISYSAVGVCPDFAGISYSGPFFFFCDGATLCGPDIAGNSDSGLFSFFCGGATHC